jgi:anaerobic C4-dicarboxylate transporter
MDPAPGDKIPTGIFGTRIPSAISFIIGIGLFFLPFIDIRCNNTSIQQVSGFQLATGFKMNNNSSDNPYLNKIKSPGIDQNITEAATKTEKNKPNIYALVGLCLAVAGTLLCFMNHRAASAAAGVAGMGAAGSLIGLMIDVKKKAPGGLPAGNDSQDGWLGRTMHHITNSISDNMSISIETAPWFYACILFLLLGGLFCFLRMKRLNT